jgi:UDP-N-acetylmuramoyl-L-alanyl-D-glutamate--2,6-diaminopimelate ligase
MEAYRRAKGKLFTQLGPEASAVINADDPAGEWMQSVTSASVVRYSLRSAADYTAEVLEATAMGTRFRMLTPEGACEVEMPLIGLHNVRNAMAAGAAAASLGISAETIRRTLQEMPFVAGRLQRVGPPGDFGVFVDYAHTDDALRNVLESLRPLATGKLIVVFGCGGNRDRMKRPRMAAAAEHYADRIFITSDNPRDEDPMSIIEEIMTGLGSDGHQKSRVQADRRLAIRAAIEAAESGDIVLIAGKGHENYQTIGGQSRPFDDAAEARQALQARGIPPSGSDKEHS